MATTLYCWRCKVEVPMLDEQEWEEVLPRLEEGIERVKEHRRIRGASLHEAKSEVYDRGALQRYFEITGFRETNVDALWHHRLILFGPPCTACGKPLRTPRAKLCAECGAAVTK